MVAMTYPSDSHLNITAMDTCSFSPSAIYPTHPLPGHPFSTLSQSLFALLPTPLWPFISINSKVRWEKSYYGKAKWVMIKIVIGYKEWLVSV